MSGAGLGRVGVSGAVLGGVVRRMGVPLTMAIGDGRHLKSHQWIIPEMMLLTKVQIHYLHLNYIYYIRLVCALL
jgi:hypothetical protein